MIAWHTMEGGQKRCHGECIKHDPMAMVHGKTDSGRAYSQVSPGLTNKEGVIYGGMGVVINRIPGVVVAAPASDTAVLRRLGIESIKMWGYMIAFVWTYAYVHL